MVHMQAHQLSKSDHASVGTCSQFLCYGKFLSIRNEKLKCRVY